MSDRTVPAGGAMVHGCDADGNQVQHFFPEGIEVPAVGQIRFDDNGKPNGYFGADAAWHSELPPTLIGSDVKIVPVM